jgi:hypothetical protein
MKSDQYHAFCSAFAANPESFKQAARAAYFETAKRQRPTAYGVALNDAEIAEMAEVHATDLELLAEVGISSTDLRAHAAKAAENSARRSAAVSRAYYESFKPSHLRK